MRIAGLDEAGRGSLFGPVVAAAVILNPKRRIVGLDDSKKLTPDRRRELFPRICEHALAWAIAEIDAAIAEIKSVADDGKGVDDHPSIDSHARWIPGLNKAIELLNKAYDNVQKEEDDSGAKDRAIQHIAQARKFITQAIALEQ